LGNELCSLGDRTLLTWELNSAHLACEAKDEEGAEEDEPRGGEEEAEVE
jgi:hypothetical protein